MSHRAQDSQPSRRRRITARLASLTLAATIGGACLTGGVSSASAATTAPGSAPAVAPAADSWSALPDVTSLLRIQPDSDSWS